MVMTALREGASGGALKYFLLGMLVLAGAGLIFMDMGGFFRGGITSTDVAKAGDHTISINSFDRQARASIQRLGMSPAQAYQVGYIKELLNGEIRTSLLQQHASELGVQVGMKQVADNLQKIIQPMRQPGQSNAAVLQQILRAQGMTEQALTASVRREMTVNMLGNAIQSAFLDSSQTLAKDMAGYIAETRDIEFIVFKDADFKDFEDPSDDQLLGFYEATKEAYATPEMRKSKAVIIKTESLKSSLEISDEEIKDVYERNIGSYRQPETRKIEQVILADADEAEQVAAALQNGSSLKNAVQEVTGNTTDYIPAKSVEKAELLDDLQDAVFNAKKDDIIGPVETALGSQIIVLNSIKAENTTPLDTVKKDIRAELEETRLLDAQYDLANSLDDYLAAGEPLESIEEELGVHLIDFPFSSKFGTDLNGKPVFTKEFGPDAQDMIIALYELGEGESSSVSELADGRMAAIILETIKEKTYTPFEDVKDDLKKRWVTDTRAAENKTYVSKLLDIAEDKDISLGDIAAEQNKELQKQSGLKRDVKAKAPLTEISLQNIFSMPLHKVTTLNVEGGTALVKVIKSKTPSDLSEEQIKAAENKIMQDLQVEAYNLYLKELQNDYGVNVNEALLETVYGQQDTQ